METVSITLSSLGILILLAGCTFSIVRKKRYNFLWYFLCILLIECLSHVVADNLFLISISYYIHFIFLCNYINVPLLKWKASTSNIFIAIMAIPMIATLVSTYFFKSYIALDRVIYNFTLIILAINVLVGYFNGTINMASSVITMMLSIIAFFSIDFILALSFNYLIKENLDLVGYFWLFRLTFLLIYYGTTVYVTTTTKLSQKTT
ncbi:hypothetical protein [Neptunitalea lumnitzerae]|nr:hypothetical protein [Neptunitalea sp. Y10]